MNGLSGHKYSAEDFERYHNGRMSAAERHALEKAALDDPFLADALEGYEYTSAPAGELEAIRTKMAAKIHGSVPVIKRQYGWMRVAALFIVVAGISWWLYQNNRPQNGIAVNPPAEKQSLPVTTSDSAIAGTDAVIPSAETIHQPSADTIQYGNLAATGNVFSGEQQQETLRDLRPDIVAQEIAVDSAKGTERLQVTVSVSPSYKNQVRNAPVLSGPATYNNNTRNALEANAVPVRNDADKTRVDTTTAVATADGYFSNVKRNQDTLHMDVVLKEQATAAPEVVVLQKDAASTESKMARYRQPVIGETEPIEGWQYYNDYVAGQRVKMPEVDPLHTGEVELTFDVNAKGEPVNITITKSVSEKCDAEAIRILKEGPRWKKTRKKGKLTITF